MRGFVLRFEINGKTIDCYKNNKRKGKSLLRQNDNIVVDDDIVILKPNSIFELEDDMMYYIHCKNDEFEDGDINEDEHKSVHEWFNYHLDELDKITDAFRETIGKSQRAWNKRYTGRWILTNID